MRLCRDCIGIQAGRKPFTLARHSRGCFICEGKVFGKAEKILLAGMRGAEGLEFSSFQVGTRLPEEVAVREELALEIGGVEGAVSLKSLLNKRLSQVFSEKTGARAELFEPELRLIVDVPDERVEFEPQPLYVAGRYRKLSREVAQSKWHCRKCNGRGCAECGGRGRMYESVEEKVGEVLRKAAEGEGTKFHSSGREDVDARMLGSGRPFAIEIIKPKKRRLDLTGLELAANSLNKGVVEVEGLFIAGKKFMEMLHNARLDKRYRVLAELESPVEWKELKKLKPVIMRQQTPVRVLHRRSNLERVRRIKEIKAKKAYGNFLELEISTEAGAYVKEFVSGDFGRTTPSLSEILGRKAKALELDVVEIEKLIEDWW